MLKANKKLITADVVLFVICVLFTILVKFVDVKAYGPNGSLIGLATINKALLIKYNHTIFKITDFLGYIPILIAMCYVLIGIIQLIKRKSLKKVDSQLYVLGALYVVTIAIYIIFDKFAVNYRPVIIDGTNLEPSYPSSHTLICLVVCGSAVIVNKLLFNSFKYSKTINIIYILLGSITVIGRMVSGAHWFTDIIGGVLISAFLLLTFLIICLNLSKNRN